MLRSALPAVVQRHALVVRTEPGRAAGAPPLAAAGAAQPRGPGVSCSVGAEIPRRRVIGNAPGSTLGRESLVPRRSRQPGPGGPNAAGSDRQPGQGRAACRRLIADGYTATPFANVFIHERGRATAEGEDLFPRSFIVNLPAPSNYVGPGPWVRHPVPDNGALGMSRTGCLTYGFCSASALTVALSQRARRPASAEGCPDGQGEAARVSGGLPRWPGRRPRGGRR